MSQLTLHSPSTITTAQATITFKMLTKFNTALDDCHPELRAGAEDLIEQLQSGQLSEHEEFATTALLMDMLFPNMNNLGISIESMDDLTVEEQAEAQMVIEDLDRDEKQFAERVRALMKEQGLTQVQLAEMVELGQPAISMMLNRSCRPQRQTVKRFADALGVAPKEIWPSFAE